MINKLLFFFRKPRVVAVAGRSSKIAKEAISNVLKPHFSVGKEILILDLSDSEAEFFLRKSPLPFLATTHLGEYHPDHEAFAGEIDQASKIIKSAEILPGHGFLVLNFDDETVRDMKNKSRAHILTFGLGQGADVRATDIMITQFPAPGTNFKINYKGTIVPCWLGQIFGRDHIYAALAAAAVGLALDINLVKISEALRGYRGLPGRMMLLRGIKKSWILDDSENASPLSMLEALQTLRRIYPEHGRRIAVLGDIIGVGKYTTEAHEAIGGDAKALADLLVTVGERAKFFAQGAITKGMAEDKIFQFDDAVSAGQFLQGEIKESDIILIDGSKEMNMINIMKELEAAPIV